MGTGLSNEKAFVYEFVLPSTSMTKTVAPILKGVMQIIRVFVVHEVLEHEVAPSHIDGV